MNNRLLISLVALLILAATPSWLSANEILATPLQKGFYKGLGVCEKMQFLWQDISTECGTNFGIDAEDPDLPVFIFTRNDGGGWLFRSSKSVTNAKNISNLAVYEISSFLDFSENTEFNYNGECTIEVNVNPVTLHCTLWSDSKKSKIAREVVFKISGAWQFDRAEK